jgi:phospholipid N-methyltransferase
MSKLEKLPEKNFKFILKRMYDDIDRFGRNGDFITSPQISSIFSEMISIWIVSYWLYIKKPKKINILELGPGNGLMIKQIINSIKKIKTFNGKFTVYLHEKSKKLIKIQKNNLNDFNNIIWVKNINTINQDPTIIVANEFFDAFPIKQFFKENKLPVSQTIFNAAQKHLSSTQVFENYYLDFQLRGTYIVALPYYLREENYLKIKENINHLTLKKGFLTDISNKEKFDLANLSNIFEYMNENLFQEQALFLEEIMANQSKIAYWNLLVSRDLNSQNKQFRTIETKCNDLCFFYKSFHLNQFQS